MMLICFFFALTNKRRLIQHERDLCHEAEVDLEILKSSSVTVKISQSHDLVKKFCARKR